ncbi:MAG: flagellar basal body rod protein FlgB [Candidatus Competibacteraceae bacterium]
MEAYARERQLHRIRSALLLTGLLRIVIHHHSKLNTVAFYNTGIGQNRHILCFPLVNDFNPSFFRQQFGEQTEREAAHMGISFDRALRLHSQALKLRSQRTEIMAANLANADTPDYKARDLDFKEAMASALGADRPLKATHAAHLQGQRNNPGDLLYRIPTQMSLDGNSVDAEREKAVFADNALRYQASLRFLGSRVQGLMTAIKGE